MSILFYLFSSLQAFVREFQVEKTVAPLLQGLILLLVKAGTPVLEPRVSGVSFGEDWEDYLSLSERRKLSMMKKKAHKDFNAAMTLQSLVGGSIASHEGNNLLNFLSQRMDTLEETVAHLKAENNNLIRNVKRMSTDLITYGQRLDTLQDRDDANAQTSLSTDTGKEEDAVFYTWRLRHSMIMLPEQAMASIAAAAEADRNAMRMRDKELAAVNINATDVDIIANELE
ncbi:hypothetical protein KI387_043755, partial [Taxus chinensis]